MSSCVRSILTSVLAFSFCTVIFAPVVACGTEKHVKECAAKCEAEAQECGKRHEKECEERAKHCGEECAR
jgi:hypothetical protein